MSDQIKTVVDLIAELQKHPPGMPVECHYSYFDCTGHGPDEYCYCSYEDVFKPFSSITTETWRDGKKLKQPAFCLHVDRY